MLAVSADEPIHAMSLLATPTGHLTNLSTAPRGGSGTVPLFPSASDPSNRQGFLRVLNHSDEAGRVEITAFGDNGSQHGPLTLSIGAREVAHINSGDLERGNTDKGLAGATGTGAGDWRLELASDLDIEVLAYTRIKPTDDAANTEVAGFLTAMHDVAPRTNNLHRVAIFNPGSNANQVSRLRLVNPGTEAASVTINGIDDRGRSPGGDVRASIPAQGALTLSAAELEAGGVGRAGALGNGAGKWRLVVEADRPVLALSLMESPNGLLTNLSTTPNGHRTAANEVAQAVFQTLVSAPIVQAKCIACHVQGGESERTRLIFVPRSNPDHLTLNFSAFKDFLVDFEDGAARILDKIQGIDHDGGVQVVIGTGDYAAMDRFLDRLTGAASAVTNKRPRVAFIDNQTLTIGDSMDITVDVTDGDGMDTHSLEASVPENCVVALATVDNTLTLTGLLAGRVEVTVTATDDSDVDNATSRARTFTVDVRHPEPPEWALPRGAPAERQVSTCAVAEVLDHVFTDEAVQAALLLRDGTVIGERYAEGYGVESLVTSWSVAKSLYSAAVGVAIDEGYIESLDQEASDFFDEWVDTNKEDITIRNLLEMRAGFADSSVFVQPDQTQFSLDQPLVNTPGSTFLYFEQQLATVRTAAPSCDRHERPRVADGSDLQTHRHRRVRDWSMARPLGRQSADLLLCRHAGRRLRPRGRAVRERRYLERRDRHLRGIRRHQPGRPRRVVRLAMVGAERDLLSRCPTARRRERRPWVGRAAHLRLAGRGHRAGGVHQVRARSQPRLRLESAQLPEHLHGPQQLPRRGRAAGTHLQRISVARAHGGTTLTHGGLRRSARACAR